jgi:type I restriction enzyme, S subunit
MRSGPTAKTDRASTNVSREYQIKNGDHLFSWSGSLTHCRWTHGPGALNQHLFKVTPLPGIPEWLTYLAIDVHMQGFQAIAAGKAVTMGHIQRRHLDEASVPLPSSAELRAMEPIMAPIHDLGLAAALESKTLAELRDIILPKLISGELRVKDADKRIAAA